MSLFPSKLLVSSSGVRVPTGPHGSSLSVRGGGETPFSFAVQILANGGELAPRLM